MIIRDLGVRHARKALAAPLRQACLRCLSTEQNPTSTSAGVNGISDADLAAAAAALETPTSTATAEPPAIFTANARPSPRRKKPDVEDTTVERYKLKWAMKNTVGRYGAHVQRTYRPGDVFRNPPGPKDVTLELLMASQAHMGHHASLWNPANARYIFGVREGIHIISLEQTAAHLRRAARVVEEVAYRGGIILFVGTRQGHMQIVTQAARLAGACHLFNKWTPGSITNSEVILEGIPMQIVDEYDQPVLGFEKHLQDRRALIPDLVVCLNPLENFTLLHECSLVNVPTIGVIDTNTEPTWVTYAIPANDDSLRCLAVIGSVLGRAGETGQKRRKQDVKKGIVTWKTPLDVEKFMKLQVDIQKRKAWQAAEDAEGTENGASSSASPSEPWPTL